MDKLMTDTRRNELIKAAEQTIGLMNIGVDGNAALSKVAKDHFLNDHEVDLVTHAVNNSKQLAHIQTSEPDEREKTFALINAETVKSFKDEPVTNADINTGDRYGPQETLGDTTREKQDAPDSLEIQKKILEKSADYRRRADTPDHARVLREGWGLSSTPKLAQYRSLVPYAEMSSHRIGIEEARLKMAQAREASMQAISTLVNELRRSDAPRFARVEKIALHRGADKETLDLIYKAAALEKFKEPRFAGTKTAGTLYVSEQEDRFADLCVRADTFWKEAASAGAALDVLTARAGTRLAEIKEAQSSSEFSLSEPYSASMAINPGSIAEELNKGIDSFGLDPATIRGAMDSDPDAEVSSLRSIEEALPRNTRQDMANTNARASVENLMEDEYIGGHDLPEVVDAYNAAMSVNPEFGRAELVSYIRQHLATKGAVPLELQMRASRSYKKDE